jgi:hypothetical protein
MDMRVGTWNVRSFYRSGSLTVGEGEIGKCELDLVGLQEAKSGTEPAGDMFFCRTWLINHYGI